MRCYNFLVYRLIGNNVGDDFRPCWEGLWQAILHRWMSDKCLLAWTHQPPWNVHLRVGNWPLWKHLLCKGTSWNVWREKQPIWALRRGSNVWKLWQVAKKYTSDPKIFSQKFCLQYGLYYCYLFWTVILFGASDSSLFTGALDALQKPMTATKMTTA